MQGLGAGGALIAFKAIVGFRLLQGRLLISVEQVCFSGHKSYVSDGLDSILICRDCIFIPFFIWNTYLGTLKYLVFNCNS